MKKYSAFDIWLERFSYIAQVGLFFITVFTIFYTVIPIYQNASLQESIAIKEKQLKELNKNLLNYYIKNRSIAIKEYISNAALKCTSLLTPPEPPLPPSDKMPAYKMKSLNKDIISCIDDPDVIKKIQSQLNTTDVSIFNKNKINSLENIKKIKLKYLTMFNEYDKKSKYDDAIIPKNDKIVDDVISMYGKLDKGTYIYLREANRQKELERIESEYEDKVRQEVYKLRKIQWGKLDIYNHPENN
ncbi:TPA: hypothetical protein ACUA66_001777 [Escherichia coli]